MSKPPFRDDVEYEFFRKLASDFQFNAYVGWKEGMSGRHEITEEFEYDGVLHSITMKQIEIVFIGSPEKYRRFEENPELIRQLLRMTTGRE